MIDIKPERTGTGTAAAAGREPCKTGVCCAARNAQNKSKMAAPRLTTCQVPPCSNPSFETFVATRAATTTTQQHPDSNGKQNMSVIDILNDIKSSESMGKHCVEEKRPGCPANLSKPVVCPKETIEFYFLLLFKIFLPWCFLSRRLK